VWEFVSRFEHDDKRLLLTPVNIHERSEIMRLARLIIFSFFFSVMLITIKKVITSRNEVVQSIWKKSVAYTIENVWIALLVFSNQLRFCTGECSFIQQHVLLVKVKLRLPARMNRTRVVFSLQSPSPA
jgi:hypothetical protein